MKKIFLLFFAILLNCVLFGINDFPVPQDYRPLAEEALIQSGKSVTLQNYPDASAVLVDDLEVTRVQNDGTGVTIDDYCCKILTDEGGRQFRTLPLHFSAVYEKPEVLKAQLIRGADGKVVSLDPKTHSRIGIDPSQMSSEIFDPNQRVLTLTFPELKPGDMIRVVFKVTAFKVRMPQSWCDITLFQSDQPVLRYTRIIEMPKSLPLRSTALKNVPVGCVSASQKEKEGYIHYTWSAHDLPQIIPEPAMPGLASCAARLLVSTNGSWQEISKWYEKLCRPRLQKITPALKAKCVELTAGKKSEMEKIRALNDFVSRNIRYTGITAEAAAPGYEPHDVSLTFERGHGVCRDKAALLTAMLNAVGIPGRMVLIMAGDPKDDEVPNMYFNHAVVAVERKDHTYLLMDPTNENSTELFPAYLANCSYLPAREQGETLLRSPSEPAEKHAVRISTKITLDTSDRMSGTTTITPTGILDQIYRSGFYELPPERVRHLFASWISGAVPGIRITSLHMEPADLQDTGKPLKITLGFTAGDVLMDHSSVQPIPLPRFAPIFSLADNFWQKALLPERKFPLKAMPRMVTEEFSLMLPDTVQCVAVPEPCQAEIPGVWRFGGTLKQTENVISGTNFWSLDAAEIQPSVYKNLMEKLKTCSAWWNSPLLVRQNITASEVFQRKKNLAGEDHYAVLQRDKKVRLVSDGTWEETLHERRLLQKNGEGNLRFSYYEVLEQLEISGFTVTAGQQKIPLSANEIKRMDAPWSAASTRYPGGKILTVSFPGAEPGAEIDFTLKRKVSGRPFFSAVLTAQEKVPVKQRKFELAVAMPEKNTIRRSPETLGFNVTGKKHQDEWIFTVAADSSLRLPDEPHQPTHSDFLPSIHFSNGNYRDYGARLDAALRKSVAQRGQGIRDLAAQICALPEKDRLLSLQQMVARSFRFINAPLNRLPIDRFADPESTKKANEVSSADRAVFIAAILEELKIDYRFVAVSNEACTFRRMRDLNAFPEEIFTAVLLYLPKENCYLNDVGEYGRPGAVRHEGKIGLELRSGHLKQIVPKRGFESGKKIDCKITFTPAGFSARYKVRCQFSGNAFESEAARFASLTPLRRKRYFEAMTNRIVRGGRIVKTEVDFSTYPGFWEVTLDVPECGSQLRNYRTVALPLFDELVSTMKFSAERRRTPYLNDFPVKLQYSCDVNIPSGFRLLRLRSGKNELGQLGEAIYTEYISTWGQGLSVNGRLEIPVRSFTPGEYRSFEEIAHYLNQPDNQKIIFVNEKE